MTFIASAFLPLDPTKFESEDLGNPRLPGTTTSNEGGFDVTAAGTDIWGTRDEGRFVYCERAGDFDIALRIASLEAADPYTKAGIMARETLAEGSKHAYFQVFPDNSQRNNNNGGYEFQYRLIDGAEMKAIYPESAIGDPAFPVIFPTAWLRLSRQGNLFIGYYGSEGGGWKPYGTVEISMPPIVLVGIAVTSHNEGRYTTASFRDISDFRG